MGMILTLQGALLAPSLLAGGAPASRAPALRPPLLGTLGRAPSCPPRCVTLAAERDAARGDPALEGRGGGDPGGTGRRRRSWWRRRRRAATRRMRGGVGVVQRDLA